MEIGFIFLIILAVVFLLYVRREGLEASGSIQPLPQPYSLSNEQLEARFNKLDSATQSAMTRYVTDPNVVLTQVPNTLSPKQKAGFIETMILKYFYDSVYSPATTPITEAQIDQFLQRFIQEVNDLSNFTPQQKDAVLSIFKDGTMKNILKSYFIPSPQTAPPVASLPASATRPTGPISEVSRPISTDPKLRMTVASYSGIPGNNTGEIEKYITYVQRFYDNYYLPNKQPPSQMIIQDFVRSIPASEFPPEKRASLEAIIDNWFTQFETPASLLAANPQSQQQRGTPATTTIQTTTQTPTTSQPVTTFTPPEPAKDSTKIFGPVWKGFGKAGGDGDGDGKDRVYPDLLGGYAGKTNGKEFDLPSADSLGLNLGSQFLPFSRSPGDQDGAFSKFRIGNAFQPSKTDPVPALTDFSAFQ